MHPSWYIRLHRVVMRTAIMQHNRMHAHDVIHTAEPEDRARFHIVFIRTTAFFSHGFRIRCVSRHFFRFKSRLPPVRRLSRTISGPYTSHYFTPREPCTEQYNMISRHPDSRILLKKIRRPCMIFECCESAVCDMGRE